MFFFWFPCYIQHKCPIGDSGVTLMFFRVSFEQWKKKYGAVPSDSFRTWTKILRYKVCTLKKACILDRRTTSRKTLCKGTHAKESIFRHCTYRTALEVHWHWKVNQNLEIIKSGSGLTYVRIARELSQDPKLTKKIGGKREIDRQDLFTFLFFFCFCNSFYFNSSVIKEITII